MFPRRLSHIKKMQELEKKLEDDRCIYYPITRGSYETSACRDCDGYNKNCKYYESEEQLEDWINDRGDK